MCACANAKRFFFFFLKKYQNWDLFSSPYPAVDLAG